MRLILGSTSIYRAAVLKRSGFTFEQAKPPLNEETLKNKLLSEKKSPLEIANILSEEKGQSLLKTFPEATIISGDQLLHIDNQIMGKPGSFDNAVKQLSFLNNRTHRLITCTTVLHRGKIYQDSNIAYFKMKNLSVAEIESYIKLDEPYDCAGSCKIEKHGMSLFESIECSDFSAIEGLPLIWITNTLKGLGYELFKKQIN
jgi:septum formation protein